MRPECIAAVSQALGREITQREGQRVEERLLDAMRQLARRDPAAWRQLDRGGRLTLGARAAAESLTAEAAKQKQRAALTLLARDRTMNRYAAFRAEGLGPFQAVARVLDDAQRYAKGVANEYFSGLVDTLDAVDSRFLGLIEDAGTAADLVREIFGESTGNARAAKGAKAWLDTVEAMRARFNAAGGDVGKLDYGYVPLYAGACDQALGLAEPKSHRGSGICRNRRPSQAIRP
jgi:hypothetical protein